MQGHFDKQDVTTHQASALEVQLEECQALIRLQHAYITHMERGLDVMKGMAAYIELLEARLDELGVEIEGLRPDVEPSH